MEQTLGAQRFHDFPNPAVMQVSLRGNRFPNGLGGSKRENGEMKLDGDPRDPWLPAAEGGLPVILFLVGT